MNKGLIKELVNGMPHPKVNKKGLTRLITDLVNNVWEFQSDSQAEDENLIYLLKGVAELVKDTKI